MCAESTGVVRGPSFRVDPRAVGRLRAFARFAAGFSVLLGVLVLIGWWLDISRLKSIFPDLVAMKPNTAVGFIFAGLSLWMAAGEPLQPVRRRLSQGLGCLVLLLGALTLGEYLFQGDLGIDQVVLQDRLTDSGVPEGGRMSQASALNLLLLGLGLLGLDWGTRGKYWLAQSCAFAVTLSSVVALVGYAYGIEALYQVSLYSSMALEAAGGSVVLAVGLLCARPERGVVAVFASEGLGGAMARRLLPAAIGIPLVLGWLKLQGERAGLYPGTFGTGLVAITNVVVLTAVSYLFARWLGRVDAERQRAEETFDRFFHLSLDLLCIAGLDGYFKRVNPAWTKVLGCTEEELLARPYLDFVHPDDREATCREGDKIARGIATHSFENRYRVSDGSYRWLSWKATPVPEQGLIYAAARDMTERKQGEAALAELNRELEAFTYSVSHDLRAPLRHVDGFSKILLEEYGPQLDPTAQRYLSRVRQGTQNMGQLIDDLLSFSRLGRQPVNWQVSGLNSVVEGVVSSLKPETEGRAIEWRIEKLPFVECDPLLLKQVFVNLLSNAVKYSRPRNPAVIEVGAQSENGQPVLYVRDNGVGFSMKYAGKLFGVFQRLHRPEDFEGTGVGLATVQRIIHKHGGRVWAEAELEKGATFYFTLGSGEGAEREAAQDKSPEVRNEP